MEANGYNPDSSAVRVGVNTSRWIGIDPEKKQGPLMTILGYTAACGVDIGKAVCEGCYNFSKKGEKARVEIVYSPPSTIPARIKLDGRYLEGMEFGISGKDHFADWSCMPHDAMLSQARFEAWLKKRGLETVADMGINPVYHVIAKPSAMKGNPLESDLVVVSGEYPNVLANWFLWQAERSNTPLTIRFVHPRQNEAIGECRNDISGKDRKTVEIHVTPGKTEYTNGVISDITQSGSSLLNARYEPLIVIAESTPLMVGNSDVVRSHPELTRALKETAEAAVRYHRVKTPELFLNRFEQAFPDIAPELVRDYRQTVTKISAGSSGHGGGFCDGLVVELFPGEPQPVTATGSPGRRTWRSLLPWARG